MTQDEIISMARQAGFVVTHIGDPIGTNYIMIETFAKLVDAKATAKERNACIEIAESKRHAPNFQLTSMPPQNGTAVDIANAIRARGEPTSRGEAT